VEGQELPGPSAYKRHRDRKLGTDPPGEPPLLLTEMFVDAHRWPHTTTPSFLLCDWAAFVTLAPAESLAASYRSSTGEMTSGSILGTTGTSAKYLYNS